MVRRCFGIEGCHIMHRLYHILSREWSPQAAIHDDKNMVILIFINVFFNILFIGGSFKIVLN